MVHIIFVIVIILVIILVVVYATSSADAPLVGPICTLARAAVLSIICVSLAICWRAGAGSRCACAGGVLGRGARQTGFDAVFVSPPVRHHRLQSSTTLHAKKQGSVKVRLCSSVSAECTTDIYVAHTNMLRQTNSTAHAYNVTQCCRRCKQTARTCRAYTPGRT